MAILALLGWSWYRIAQLKAQLAQTRRELRLVNETADYLARMVAREKGERSRWERAYASTLPRDAQ